MREQTFAPILFYAVPCTERELAAAQLDTHRLRAASFCTAWRAATFPRAAGALRGSALVVAPAVAVGARKSDHHLSSLLKMTQPRPSQLELAADADAPPLTRKAAGSGLGC